MTALHGPKLRKNDRGKATIASSPLPPLEKVFAAAASNRNIINENSTTPLREWEPPDEGEGVPQPRDLPLQRDLERARSLEADSLDPRRRPAEFVPPEASPPPSVIPERPLVPEMNPDEEEEKEEKEEEEKEPENPLKTSPTEPEELPWRREEEPETMT